MTNAYDAESTFFFAHGEPDQFDQTAEWTAEDWADYDAHCAAEIEAFMAEAEDDYIDLDPPF